MKKIYKNPEASIVSLSTEDIMTLSKGLSGLGITLSYEDIVGGAYNVDAGF